MLAVPPSTLIVQAYIYHVYKFQLKLWGKNKYMKIHSSFIYHETCLLSDRQLQFWDNKQHLEHQPGETALLDLEAYKNIHFS